MHGCPTGVMSGISDDALQNEEGGMKDKNQNTLNFTDTLCMLTYIAICYVVVGCLHLLSGICHGFLGKIPHYLEVSKTLILVD